MKHEDNSYMYYADYYKTFIRKADNFVMGTGLCMGEADSIDNYEEVDLTEDNDIEGILKKEQEKESKKRAAEIAKQ